MTTPQQLFSEHMNRIQTAISLGRPDRAPVVLFIDSFCVKHQNAKMSRFCTDAEYAVDTMINSVTSLGEIDGIEHVLLDPRLISAGSVCDVKLAGRDLPEGSLWQFSEVGKLTVEDYDAIIAQPGGDLPEVRNWKWSATSAGQPA